MLLGFISLFVLAIVPIFIDLGNNTKQSLEKGIEIIQVQAESNFPFLDTLPLQAGKIIRNELDTQMIANMILNKEKTTLITDTLPNNL